MEMETIGALLLKTIFSRKNVTQTRLRCAEFLLSCAPEFTEEPMTPRLHIASQIYAHLILQDMGASIENPARNAHRALLFADALLLCDQQSAPAKTDMPAQPDPRNYASRASTTTLTERLIKRRDNRSSLH